MFGSDWPVCLVAAPYAQVFATAQQLMDALSAAQREAVFGRTATVAYGLPVA